MPTWLASIGASPTAGLSLARPAVGEHTALELQPYRTHSWVLASPTLDSLHARLSPIAIDMGVPPYNLLACPNPPSSCRHPRIFTRLRLLLRLAIPAVKI